jgi:hypothetical protein
MVYRPWTIDHGPLTMDHELQPQMMTRLTLSGHFAGKYELVFAQLHDLEQLRCLDSIDGTYLLEFLLGKAHFFHQ